MGFLTTHATVESRYREYTITDGKLSRTYKFSWMSSKTSNQTQHCNKSVSIMVRIAARK